MMHWDSIAYIILACNVYMLVGKRVEVSLDELEDSEEGEAGFKESAQMITLDKATLQGLITEVMQQERKQIQEIIREERMEAHNLLRQELSEQSAKMVTAHTATMRELIGEVMNSEQRESKKPYREENTKTHSFVEQTSEICSCTGLVAQLQRATEEFHMQPLLNELVTTVNELQERNGERLIGNASFFLGAKLQLQQYQAAIRSIFKLSNNSSAHIDEMRFSKTGQASHSLLDVGTAMAIQGTSWRNFNPPAKRGSKSWAEKAEQVKVYAGEKAQQARLYAGMFWEFFLDKAGEITRDLKDKLDRAYAYFLKGRAYPLFEEIRMQTGEHFAENLYRITMALVQQAWDLIPKAFTNWAPAFEGINRIWGYWLESRAKIAFGDRHMKLMVSLMDVLKQEFKKWSEDWQAAISSQAMFKVRRWLCDHVIEQLPTRFSAWLLQKWDVIQNFCKPDLGEDKQKEQELDKASQLRKARSQRQREARIKAQTMTALRNAKENTAKEQSQDGEAVETNLLTDARPHANPIKRFARRFSNASARRWNSFRAKTADTVQAVFYPLFFSIAVPIADTLRMKLSEELCAFSINYMVEIVLVTPFLSEFFAFLGDEASMATIHAFAGTDLLADIFESEYMQDLEDRIKSAYGKWLLTYKGFRTNIVGWIMRSFRELGKRARMKWRSMRQGSSKRSGNKTADLEANDQMEEEVAQLHDDACSKFILKEDEDALEFTVDTEAGKFVCSEAHIPEPASTLVRSTRQANRDDV